MSTIDRAVAQALSRGKWIDVTRPLTGATPVWPGDTPVEVRTRREDGLVVSSFTATCHAGTHLDAPLHLDPTAQAVGQVPLTRLIGLAEVVRTTGQGDRIDRRAFPPGWSPRTTRVLVRSDGHGLDEKIEDSLCGLEPELVEWLADSGVQLIGVDTPSVDPFSSTALEAHRTLMRRGVAWIEGLWLRRVPAGLYLLLALPLRLEGTEAAPVRALLRPVDGEEAT